MKNKYLIYIVAIIILIIAAIVVYWKVSASQPTKTEEGFNFIFKYGVGAKNKLNTFNQTYTKDEIVDSSITTKLVLSKSELANINQKINELDLFNQSIKPTKGTVSITPCSSYYLKTSINSSIKELSWNDCKGSVNEKLQQFSDYVIKIIESKAEYKQLPAPKGGYL